MFRPWLWLPSQLAHDVAPHFLPIIASLFGAKTPIKYRPQTWRGLNFPNPIGIAGGVDKFGHSLLSWQKLGAGFVELGTVTPLAQSQNPGTVMARDIAHEALWNKMGFPNPGLDAIEQTLHTLKSQIEVPLFVNIGKNRKTPNEKANEDYLLCVNRLNRYADAFVVNISSPNTKDLRDLLAPETFKNFLEPILKTRSTFQKKTPLLLKLSPDMSDGDLHSCLETSLALGIDGWILTNTTLDRTDTSSFPEDGGVSGSPLTEKSRMFLKKTMGFLGPKKGDKLVISVGGIMTADEIKVRLDLGADLVQLYSALVYHGPLFLKNSLKSLKNRQ
jgi:dihydroorotate dehydrogenase